MYQYFKVRMENGEYINDTEPFFEFTINPALLFGKTTDLTESSNNTFHVNKSRLEKLDKFIEESNLICDKAILKNFFVWANFAYVSSTEFVHAAATADLDKSIHEFQKLIDILSDSDKRRNLQSVSFKFLMGTESFSNYFTIVDILSALSKVFNTENLPEHTSASLTVEKHEYAMVNDLFDYLKEQNPIIQTENRFLKFIGDFLHFAQIPLTRNDDLTSTDPTNVRKILNGKDSIKKII